MTRFLIILLLAGCAAPQGTRPPPDATLLFVNGSLDPIVVVQGGVTLGTVYQSAKACLAVRYHGGTLRLLTIGRAPLIEQHGATALDHAEGWAWEIGVTPKYSVSNLVPAPRCSIGSR